ncbi:MAG TPA: PEP-CTERM sorting domain-containing protein [Candidatus Spyradosoma merdigallinarum]|uniref:PEP-CTERM sorting domain-containing protein n=1 Tax=Candidatus Spyradosoma merdigallinarum TaxID=2840950 RepID=A0A9D1NK45_9BACT|nr:PEP-CTERM sorting domain-containing protein [Candidatus Spyradosoma merdigallinarum]
MKKCLTLAVLLSAGTVLTNAAVYTTSLTTGTADKANGCYGFTVALDDTFMNTVDEASSSVTLPETVSLDSVSVWNRDDNTGMYTGDVKLAVYAYIDDGMTGTFVGLSDNTVSIASVNQELEFTFKNVSISSTAQYQMLFVSSSATADSVDTFDEYKTEAVGISLSLLDQGGLPKGDGTYNNETLNKWLGQHMPKLSIETSSSIPEPSAFGLLAGLGALALVASRRRRR